MPMRSSAASMPCSRPPGRRPWRAESDRGRARRAFPAAECGKRRRSPQFPRAGHEKAARLFERIRLMAQRALRRDDQHPLRAHGGEQTAGQRQIIQRQKRRAHPFQRRDKRRSGQRRARRKARRGLQRHNRPLLRHALRAESDDMPASRRPAQKNALPLTQPQRALPVCAASSFPAAARGTARFFSCPALPRRTRRRAEAAAPSARPAQPRHAVSPRHSPPDTAPQACRRLHPQTALGETPASSSHVSAPALAAAQAPAPVSTTPSRISSPSSRFPQG